MLQMSIADPEVLFAMKFVAARRQDVRDIFMLAGEKLDWGLTTKLITEKCSIELIKNRADLIRKNISSEGYRDSLQGPYGKLPEERFGACKKILRGFLGEIKWRKHEEISILDDKSFSVTVKHKKSTPEERIANRIIRNPISAKMGKKHLRRRNYYESES